MDADVLRESCNLGSTWSRLAARNTAVGETGFKMSNSGGWKP
jgi:hypothetical protein